MPRGYRCIVLAAFGWLILATSPPGSRAQQKDQWHGESTQDSLKDIAASLKKANEAAKPDTGCNQGSDNRQSDLCAQWKSADAAADSADWTRRTFWLGIFGLAVGALTLVAAAFAAWFAREAARHTEAGAKEAEKAVIQAKRSAEISKAALAETRKTVNTQLRPYVYLASHSVTYHHMASIKHISDNAEVTLVFKNYGQTPACEIQLSARAFIGGIWNAPRPDTAQQLSKISSVRLADIPPYAESVSDGYTVLGLKEAHALILLGSASVFIEGQIRYVDGFGKQYFTNFRFASTEADYPQGKFVACPEWNEAT